MTAKTDLKLAAKLRVFTSLNFTQFKKKSNKVTRIPKQKKSKLILMKINARDETIGSELTRRKRPGN